VIGDECIAVVAQHLIFHFSQRPQQIAERADHSGLVPVAERRLDLLASELQVFSDSFLGHVLAPFISVRPTPRPASP